MDHYLEICPSCGGPADNGFDRSEPPVPYYCSICQAEDKWVYVDFPDTTFRIPLKKIAGKYAHYYSEKYKENYNELYREFVGDEDKVLCWVSGNLDWDDVKDWAEKVDKPKQNYNYNVEWLRSDKYLA